MINKRRGSFPAGMRGTMKTEFIPKVVMLLAGAIVCIICIVNHTDTTRSLEILLAVLIAFYLLGCIAKWIIERVIVSNRFMKETTERTSQIEDISEDGSIQSIMETGVND